MRSADLYTKVVLSIIAVCLVVLCFEQSHWSKVETVQAQQNMLIAGYRFDDSGTSREVLFGNGPGPNEKPGLPVVMAGKEPPPNAVTPK